VDSLEWQGFFATVADDLRSLDAFLQETLQDPVAEVREVVTHLLRAGGKRLRPALVFLAARFGPLTKSLIEVGAAVELIHMATLAHDDVIDEAPLRRGQPTIHARWNERIAILAGDYLFARAFTLLAETGDNRLVGLASSVVQTLCEGEIDQNVAILRGDIPDEKTYIERIGRKTAALIAEGCRMGALVSGAGEVVAEALWRFGYALGISFQIIDDILDFTGDALGFGKVPGGDLRSGVVTLPVIHALRTSAQAPKLRRMIAAGALTDDDIRFVQHTLAASDSFHYAAQVAEEYIEMARNALWLLPEGPARDVLSQMADFVLARQV
jgi:heptaprenyl diphosphate synthase